MTELHTETFGAGSAAVFVHGSFGWGAETFPEQRVLADDYQIVLVDRRGFGGAKSKQSDGWPTDMWDVAELLDELGSAHLVGQSYGAVVVLLAAGLRPERVLSLTAIEPPVFDLARGNPDVDATAAAVRPVHDRAAEMSRQEFVAEWARARGMSDERVAEWIASFGPEEWAAAEASRRERYLGDAPIELEKLRAATFPKVVVRGAWPAELAGREGAGRHFAAICDALSRRIDARLVVFEQSCHNPQIEEPERFNRLLQDVWSGRQSPTSPSKSDTSRA
ncbi:MAG: alpha/beta fold hydrolase [Solirubrobacteraceae bacterium]